MNQLARAKERAAEEYPQETVELQEVTDESVRGGGTHGGNFSARRSASASGIHGNQELVC